MAAFLFVFCEFQTLQVPSFMRRRADPKNVVSIILGGGPGTQLFPLTKRAATPAVSESWFLSETLNPKLLEFLLLVVVVMVLHAMCFQVPVGGCYRLIDIPMSNCINSGINKIFVLTQFNSASLNRHIARTYFGNDINFGDGIVEVRMCITITECPFCYYDS